MSQCNVGREPAKAVLEGIIRWRLKDLEGLYGLLTAVDWDTLDPDTEQFIWELLCDYRSKSRHGY